MAPKGGNAKKESGRAKKAENEVRRECSHRVAVAVRDVVVEWLRTNRTVVVRPFCGKKKKKQEKKKVAAEKSKEVKEAEEWKSGCTFFLFFFCFCFPKDSRPCVDDVEMKLAKGTSKADAAAAKAAEAGKFLDPFCSLYTQQNN